MIAPCLKIAHVTEAFTGGIATYMSLVLPGLVQEGFGVSLICSPGRNEPRFTAMVDDLKKAGVEVVLLPMARAIRPLGDLTALARLKRAIVAGRFDLVHTHGSKAGALGRVACFLAKRPVVHTPHCFSFLRCGGQWQKAVLVRIERLLGGLTDQLVAVSGDEQEAAGKAGIVAKNGCVVIPNGLEPQAQAGDCPDGQAVRRRFGIPYQAPLVTMICRLVKYKGIQMFLEAARICIRARKDTTFLVGGVGPLRADAEAFIVRHGLTGNVLLPGHVDDTSALLRVSAICVLCSRAEGQPYCLLEAMRAGCSIVATKAPGMAELVENDRTGLLMEASAQSLADGILKVLDDPSLRQRYSQAARQQFVKSHLLDRQVRCLGQLYGQVCQSGRN